MKNLLTVFALLWLVLADSSQAVHPACVTSVVPGVRTFDWNDPADEAYLQTLVDAKAEVIVRDRNGAILAKGHLIDKAVDNVDPFIVVGSLGAKTVAERDTSGRFMFDRKDGIDIYLDRIGSIEVLPLI